MLPLRSLWWSEISYIQFMNWFWKYNIDHMVFWTATVGFHMFTSMGMIDTVGPLQFVIEVLIRNGLLAAMIYINLMVLIPRFSKQKIKYASLLILTVAAYVLLKNVHDVYLNGYIMGDENRRSIFYNSYYNFSIAFFYLAFSVALFLSKAWYFQRELLRKMEIEKLSTELEYLKAQINPHFVFNSINAIYFRSQRTKKKSFF